MPFGGHETAATEAIASPRRIDEIAVAVDAKQLEGGEGGPGLARLPMPNGSHADAEQAGGLLTIKPREHPGITELLGRNFYIIRNTAGKVVFF